MTRKIHVTISEVHIEALGKYAKKHKLFRGGEPNISESFRRTSADGLGMPELADSIVRGNPDKLKQRRG